MSTRSVTNFCYGKTVVAKIYRHPDGYPSSMLPDLKQFFEDVKAQTKDTRFTDANYLAAKWVVWLAKLFTQDYDFTTRDPVRRDHFKERPLDFISVGVVMENPGDIEYEYFVDCEKQDKHGFPKVTYKSVRE